MNLLTGKAKTDFLLWIQSKGIKWNPTDFSLDLAEAMHYAIIKEWFDSVGIYIIDYALHNIGCGWDIDTKGKEYEGEERFKTRTEANKSAIEKANQIYNETQV